MAQPDVLRGTYFVLAGGDGGSPETFTAFCGIDTRTFRHGHNTSDQFIRDCADPEDIPVRRLIVTGESWSLSGNGVLDRSKYATIKALDDGQTHNFRFFWTEPVGNLVLQGYEEGPGIITNLEITGNDSEYGKLSLSIESDGLWTWTTV